MDRIRYVCAAGASREPRKIHCHINNISGINGSLSRSGRYCKEEPELFSTLQAKKEEVFSPPRPDDHGMGAGVSVVASYPLVSRTELGRCRRIGDQRASPHRENLRKILHRVYDLEGWAPGLPWGWPMPDLIA